MEAWGKFDESSGRFHRLEHHCADVAACFEALLRDPALRARFVQAAGVNNLSDTTVARLTFLAFLHDFGKLNTGFQFKVRRQNELSRPGPRPAGTSQKPCSASGSLRSANCSVSMTLSLSGVMASSPCCTRCSPIMAAQRAGRRARDADCRSCGSRSVATTRARQRSC